MTRRHEPVLTLPRSKYGNRRQHWLAARQTGITATDAAALLGVDPWESPLSVYIAKTAVLDDVDAASEAMYWGNQLEHVVAREWERRNRARGLRIAPTPGLLAHPARPWQMATIDRYVTTATDRGAPVAVLECKTTDSRNSEHWAEDAEPPLRVVAQVQHQLIVTGLDHAYVAVLVGGNRFRQWEIPFDAELAEQITAVEQEFRDRLERRDPPAPIGHDADDAALDALFIPDPDRTAVIPSALVSSRREFDDAEKLVKAEKKKIDQAIKFEIGEATEVLDDNGQKVATYRQQTRKSYVVAETTFRALRFTKPPTPQKESTDADA